MGGPVECFNCGGDHFARDCPQGGGKGKGKGGGKKGGGGCFKCGSPDHWARECPEGGGKTCKTQKYNFEGAFLSFWFRGRPRNLQNPQPPKT